MSNKHDVQVFAEDMSEDKRAKAIEVSQETFQKLISHGKTYSNIACILRDSFVKDYGEGWNCVVGKAFGSYVTHEMKTYM